ncbi:MAG: MerR family transcriptional regulator [Deltaproteobacteria bacterium]|nr:MerR family transcriptional regulator [Deltaproteobacteria bacterium]MBW2418023.1 MerR family transcriptional regulator [Deltaproteobacteria bacterium]
MDDSWTLDELAELTGVEARTIRHYIERGLLPGASRRGRGAGYGRPNLDRLHCIQAIKRAAPALSLDEIRRVLMSLSEERIQAIGSGAEPVTALFVDPSGTQVAESLTSYESGDSALDYITRVRGQLATGHAPPTHRAPRRHGPSSLDPLVDALRDSADGARAQRKARAEWWASIPVTPDIEIRARGLPDHDLQRLERAADYLRHILLNEDSASRATRQHKPRRRRKEKDDE